MQLITPHGGTLVSLMVAPEQAPQLRQRAGRLPAWDLSARQFCDIELLLNGGFSPLTGFMGKADYQGVCSDMRLADGTLWPMPITLDVSEDFAGTINKTDEIALRDAEGLLVAILTVTDKWVPDREVEAQQVFGSTDSTHPGVNALLQRSNPVYLGGRVTGIQMPHHYDYVPLRHTPAQSREFFAANGWERVVAFQTRNPMHRAHVELTTRAAKLAGANLLIHPVVGMTKPGDIDHMTRVKCYQAALAHMPAQTSRLSLLPLAMRMAGPREALWHALIRKNYGCTHFVVGRDHAGPGKDAQGKGFYGPYDAQDLVRQYQEEIDIEMVPFRMMVYVENRAQYQPVDEVADSDTVLSISGTELRRRLREGLDIPNWFTYPEVVTELRKAHPPLHQRGVTVFFTGLSGAGKSTIANALLAMLMEQGDRPVTLLDGDIVRKHLSSELGFSREHRNLNVERIGFVASEITKNRGVAICAPIAPYLETRRRVREMVEGTGGGFVEVHVSTPLDICEARDRKGLYALARKGVIKQFTGISDPYEAPEQAEVTIDTSGISPLEAARTIMLKLEGMGYIGND